MTEPSIRRRLLWAVPMLFVACSGSDPLRGDLSGSIRDEGLHALMADQLDVLMVRLQTLAYDQNRTIDELDDERRRQLRQVAASAEGMQRAAQGILAVQPSLGLAEADALRFRTLAGQLDAQSDLLQNAATGGDSAAVAQYSDQIRQTCQSCHQLYRGF